MGIMKKQVDREIADMAERLMSGVIDGVPAVVAVLEEQANKLVGDAKEWPVQSGKSKAGLKVTTKLVDDETVTVTVSNDVEYAYMIKAINLDGKNPFRTLIIRRGKARGKVIGKAVGAAMLQSLAKELW